LLDCAIGATHRVGIGRPSQSGHFELDRGDLRIRSKDVFPGDVRQARGSAGERFLGLGI